MSNIIILDVAQGSPEWLAARAGSLGASQLADALAKTKTGWGASRTNLKAKLIAERLTGQPQDTFSNAAMQWGIEQEPKARECYSFQIGKAVREVGLVKHPTIIGSHCSPDGLVEEDGLCEIKAPNTATHLETLVGGSIPQKYVLQMQWQMACTGRDWCDFVSYDPRLPVEMQLHVQRVARDNEFIDELERDVVSFLAEVDATVADLHSRYLKEAA